MLRSARPGYAVYRNDEDNNRKLLMQGLNGPACLRQVDGLAAETDITQWPEARSDGDPADAGVAHVARDSARSLLGHAHRMLVAVEDALDRLIHGTYGICASCDGPIARARLAALPHAALCIDCQQSQEHRR